MIGACRARLRSGIKLPSQFRIFVDSKITEKDCKVEDA